MPQLSLHSVTKTFGRITAVRDLSLAATDGELLVLVGPSGCGKTTTLRLVAGLEAPTAGTITIGARDVTRLPPRARDVAMVFQGQSLYPHLSVRGNLAFGLKLRRAPRAEIAARIDEAAQSLGIAELLPRRPAALSGGERQRVALGRALVRRPAAFLFDEPLSALDAPLRAELRREIRSLHRRLGATMLYVTHDQAEAMLLGDRLAVLRAGVLQQVGPPRAIYDEPANLFVAGFFGSPPMNFLEGRLKRTAAGLEFVALGLRLPVAPLHNAALASRADQPIILGIRPEHVCLGAPSSAGAAIACRIEEIEPLGAETHLHLSSPAGRLAARAPDRAPLRPGENLSIEFDPDRLIWFDPATGERIRCQPGAQ